MEAETNGIRCPACGGTTAAGELNVAGRGGSLQWRATRKIPRKHPLRFLKSEYFHLREVVVGLMGFDLTFSGEEIPLSVPARYCPNCKKVFAWFDAPGVPPEVCDGSLRIPREAREGHLKLFDDALGIGQIGPEEWRKRK